MSSLALVVSSSEISAVRSASFFLRVRVIRSFSYSLRLIIVGGPLTLTHCSISLTSRARPSITRGQLPDLLISFWKCYITFLKDSSSLSSDPASFSLIEAKYDSYSMCLYPNSLAIYLAALVFPAQLAPLTRIYF